MLLAINVNALAACWLAYHVDGLLTSRERCCIFFPSVQGLNPLLLKKRGILAEEVVSYDEEEMISQS